MADDVQIGDNVVLEGEITIGSGTRIDHGCIIRGNVSIGKNNWLYPYCVVGAGPQHKDYTDLYPACSGHITIGDYNVIREFATIHRPTTICTSIGSYCYIMAYPHIAHDCAIRDYVIMATRITLGGHIHIHDYANIGQGTSIHPYCHIGKYTMVGMGSSIVKDVPPFALINRLKFTKINRVGLERNGISQDDMAGIDDYYRRGMRGDKSIWYVREIELFMAGSTRKCFEPNFE